jgi:ribosomal protein S18 acetylase RimI-like enzyme
MNITIIEARTVTFELVAAFERLLPQLSPTAAKLGFGELLEIVRSPATTLFLARDDGAAAAIVGAVVLVAFRIPSGMRARIESLVVDQAARKRGVGEALCRAALARARERGADTVDLTSSPSREAANQLYRRIGFALRDTNTYRYAFTGGSS